MSEMKLRVEDSPVVVFPKREVRGWGDATDVPTDTFDVVPLRQALDKRYKTDAHFAPYFAMGVDGLIEEYAPRMNKAGLPGLRKIGLELKYATIVADIDSPKAHKEKGAATPEWRAEFHALLLQLPPEIASGMGWYETRGGARLIWQLDSPLGPLAYARLVTALQAELAVHGIDPDRLKDWGRMYRVPRALRDGVPQDWPMDLSELGPLQWRPQGFDPSEPPEGKAQNGSKSDNATQHPEAGSARGDASEVEDDTPLGRNQELTKFAGQLRHYGASRPMMLALIRSENLRRFAQDPLPDQECRDIARSVGNYAPSKPVFGRGDEVELADRLRKHFALGGAVPFVFDEAKLWRYEPTNGLWREVKESELSARLQSWAGAKLGDEGVLLLSSKRVSGAIKLLYEQLEAASPSMYFATAPSGVRFADVFVRLAGDGTLSVEEPTPEHRCRWALKVFYDPTPRPGGWHAFLEQVFSKNEDPAGTARLCQQFVGACLFGMAAVYQQAMVLFGSGANGKSVFLDAIRALFPPETVTSITPQDMKDDTKRAELSGALINLVAEMPEATILNGENFKAVVSGDPKQVRRVYETAFMLKPRAGHIFAANRLPRATDDSIGFWRRWLLVPFLRQLEASEQIAGLSTRLVSECLDEIAAWAVQGAVDRIRATTYHPVAQSAALLEEWAKESQPVRMYLEECLEADPKARTRGDVVYDHYKAWSLRNGYEPVSSGTLGKRLKALNVDSHRANGTVYHCRIRSRVP